MKCTKAEGCSGTQDHYSHDLQLRVNRCTFYDLSQQRFRKNSEQKPQIIATKICKSKSKRITMTTSLWYMVILQVEMRFSIQYIFFINKIK